ncbi:hypothetical protein ACRWEO_23990, partial [Escherichia coli]
QKQKKLIMLPSEILIWQPEFTDKTLSRKPGAVQFLFAGIFPVHLYPADNQRSLHDGLRPALPKALLPRDRHPAPDC